ncbi:MFS transporter [Herbidospora sp. NEAU-GS84]|uniref:MFS transporter n=1 Tax=Herbidospora solisilvae TaxID=2696284 RepID=A0A7C9N658_9ACTN|nr:MFS transporter [Herbidospora solisilvae]NAS27369.1 MFS transporter [Herbidospora solisilvae]
MPTPGPTADSSALPDPQTVGERRLYRRLMLSIGGTQFGISVVYGAVPGVLLALQIDNLAGEDKVGILSLLTLAGAVAALIAQPAAGWLSDRTRTRAGGRTPYILGGSVLAAPVLWAMGWTQSLTTLAILYVTSEFILSAAQGPLAAVLPDRVPPERRGRFSAALGLGIMIGSVSGTVLASLISPDLRLAYLIVGCFPIALACTRLLIDPDPANTSAPCPSRGIGAAWLISPRRHPGFWWVLGSRMLVYTGFFMIQGATASTSWTTTSAWPTAPSTCCPSSPAWRRCASASPPSQQASPPTAPAAARSSSAPPRRPWPVAC